MNWMPKSACAEQKPRTPPQLAIAACKGRGGFQGVGYRLQGLRLRVQGSGFTVRVQGVGFKDFGD